MIDVNNTRCVGCSACFANCPTKAISLRLSEEGFLYPHIDAEQCTGCGVCETVCPIDKKVEYDSVAKAYYGWHSDDNVRYRSSSGGFFTALAEQILADGGIVYGAVFDGRDYVYGNTDSYELDDLRKSKYTEIKALDSFVSVKANIETGRKVLFCGTPCRVAGLKTYLKKEYENLILVDFICGGVASPKFLFEDKAYHEKKNKSTLKSIDFRCKKSGWGGQHLMKLSFENGKDKVILAREDAYFTGFLSKLINRKSCYTCHYTDNHFSDITMADFWDFKKIQGLANDGKGMSLIVAHTLKGNAALSDLEQFSVFPIDYNIVSGNFIRTGYYEKISAQRDAFCKKALTEGFISASGSYMKQKTILKYKLRYFIKNALGMK